MIATLITVLIRTFVAVVNLFPLNVRLYLLQTLLRLWLFFAPKYKAISLKNLTLAFPNQDESWKAKILSENIASLARLMVDALRLPTLDKSWAEKNVEIPLWNKFQERRKEGRSILIASGHLGSFELQGYLCSLLGTPISFVVRNFQLKPLDRWWNGVRGRHGNKVIDRRGAFREIIQDLKSKRPVALLFDQNVTRRHAIFVDWFGKKAATTKALGIAALKTEAIIYVSALIYLGGERYKLDAAELNFDSLYGDPALSDDEKIERITKGCVEEFEKLVRAYPHCWFWMHRKWKTRPDPNEPEDFYLALNQAA